MTTRNFQFLFQPRNVALIGASDRPSSVGGVLARNLSTSGYKGTVMLVNPRLKTIGGARVYPSVEALPQCPDLAVIATPAETVPALISELGTKGARAAVVISSGFSEGGDEAGKKRQQQMLEAASPHGLRIVGPNCVGLMVPRVSLNASFAHLQPRPGRVAFVAQSGAILTSVLDWADPRDIGFSCLVSLGDMADVDFGDVLDYLATDPETSAVLLYIEAITHARKFMSAARAAARSKPVLVVKGGRSAEGQAAASSHTGALIAGSRL